MEKLRILVANRGEVALRIIRAIKELGHIPLSIHSKADRMSLHVAKSEGTFLVGDGPSIYSYMNIEMILKAAEILKADAIHPGYGFLSEKPEFAEAVTKAGLIFIGPKAEHISKMGDKVQARKTMAEVGLKPVPGTNEPITDEKLALIKADEIGYPVMIKALAGGGGRGMRLVEKREDFINQFQRAQSESQKAFNDSRLYLEKYISCPHHIEVQVLADQHGNACHLFDRECSVQRRHQKLVEEASSPFITDETRDKLCSAAREAIKRLGYINAGTIEFLVDGEQNFYFMEMNTRLQVEHPITEWITGIDIVKEQINIAQGKKLSFTQEEVKRRGHSIEFRINAEDPEKFMPQSGRVSTVMFPAGFGVRVDSHLYRGYEIPVFYDSLIAKISIWGQTRNEVIQRARVALAETVLTGIKTNVPFHLKLLSNSEFLSGNYTTQLIGPDFKLVFDTPDFDQIRMAVISAAVSAYNKEYKEGSFVENEFSRWKHIGRSEALRT